MAKSYEPLNPKPRKKPPDWVHPDAPRSLVTTDDCEFGLCVVRDSPTSRGLLDVAYKSRAGWSEVQVVKKRAKVQEMGK